MRLGRLPHDPAALASAPSFAAHHFAAVKPPALLDRSHIEFAPGLYRNDDLPDCSAAGLANAAGMVAALNGYGLAVNPDKVPLFYASASLTDAQALLATLTASTPAPTGASTLARIDTDIGNVLAAISPIVSTIYPIAGPVIAAVQTLLPVVEAWVNPLITSATGVSAVAPVSPDAAAAARKALGIAIVK